VGWTKAEIVSAAFGELALADFDFDITPDEQQACGRRLDAMMATWQGQGVTVPYAFSAGPDVDLTQDSGLPLNAVEAVYTSLALRQAASKGKAVPASLKASAKHAYDSLASVVAHAEVTQQQYRAGTPRGSGSKPWRTTNAPFVPVPTTSPLQLADDGGLNFGEG